MCVAFGRAALLGAPAAARSTTPAPVARSAGAPLRISSDRVGRERREGRANANGTVQRRPQRAVSVRRRGEARESAKRELIKAFSQRSLSLTLFLGCWSCRRLAGLCCCWLLGALVFASLLHIVCWLAVRLLANPTLKSFGVQSRQQSGAALLFVLQVAALVRPDTTSETPDLDTGGDSQLPAGAVVPRLLAARS
eukprot:scaffold18906_cov122-Isochrysis_galbana.AAC.7